MLMMQFTFENGERRASAADTCNYTYKQMQRVCGVVVVAQCLCACCVQQTNGTTETKCKKQKTHVPLVVLGHVELRHRRVRLPATDCKPFSWFLDRQVLRTANNKNELASIHRAIPTQWTRSTAIRTENSSKTRFVRITIHWPWITTKHAIRDNNSTF